MRRWMLVAVAAVLLGAAPAARAQAPAAIARSASSPVCAGCGQGIGPGRYVVDQWKHAYHTEHAQLPRCTYCARGISAYNTQGGVRYADGREVCNVCRATAVEDVRVAQAATARVRARLESWGLRFAYGTIPIQLVDQASLERSFGRSLGAHDGKINGLTTKKWAKDAKGRVVMREVTIHMLDGLPLEVYEKTVAHELMHAWMFLDDQPQHAPALEEGVCNLASYYWLQESSTPLAGFMREAMYKSASPAYGEGLRRAVRYVQRFGFNGLVTMLRAEVDFPAGY